MQDWVFRLGLGPTYFFNRKFLLQIKKINATMAELTSNSPKNESKEDRKMTNMIMTIVGIFLICNFTRIIFYFFNLPEKFKGSIWRLISSVIVHLFMTINSSTNVIVYGIFSKKYREMFLQYFCPNSSKSKNNRPKKLSIVSSSKRNSNVITSTQWSQVSTMVK